MSDEKHLKDTLVAVLTWAEQRCPCENDLPKICPLCGANVDNPNDGCLSAENTIPKDLLSRIRVAVH